MQFLIVRAQAISGGEFYQKVPVLIDGEPNGETDSPIMLDRGTFDVSVKMDGAETVTVSLDNTTPTEPQEVTVAVLDRRDMDTVCLSPGTHPGTPVAAQKDKKIGWAKRLFSKIRRRR